MQNFNRLVNITILQYPKGTLSYASGKIIEINRYEFGHLVSTKAGSSGSPIFLKDTTTVIGIHKSESRNYEKNFGDFIGPIFYFLRNLPQVKVKPMDFFDYGTLQFNKKSKLKLKLFPGSFYGNGNNNKVFKLQPDKNNFVNDRNEGYHKIVYEDGEYYIGQMKNGLRNGKGILYNKNGTIKYEGYWLNDLREGKGKPILENGDYYIGYYKDNKKNGKGIIYKKDGKIKYDGDYLDGKREGNGKYYYDNRDYYIGQFKNNFKNGNGTLYYKNGKIKYEGNWVDDKMQGYGKYFYENRRILYR